MWILVVEAGVAFFLLAFIVWWTMFSGRDAAPPKREKPPAPKETDTPQA